MNINKNLKTIIKLIKSIQVNDIIKKDLLYCKNWTEINNVICELGCEEIFDFYNVEEVIKILEKKMNYKFDINNIEDFKIHLIKYLSSSK